MPYELLVDVANWVQGRSDDTISRDVLSLRLVCRDFAAMGARVIVRSRGWNMPLQWNLRIVDYDSSQRSLEVMHAVLHNPVLNPHICVINYKFYNVKEESLTKSAEKDKVYNHILRRSRALEATALHYKHRELMGCVSNDCGHIAGNAFYIRPECDVPRMSQYVSIVRERWLGFFTVVKFLAWRQPKGSENLMLSGATGVCIDVFDMDLFLHRPQYLVHAFDALRLITRIDLHFEESTLRITGTLHDGWPKVLASAYNLETLVILKTRASSSNPLSTAENQGLQTETLLKGLLVEKHWPQLKSFSLVNFRMHFTDLRDFVLRHRQTLTNVGFDNFHVNDGLWRAALGLLKVQLELNAASVVFGKETRNRNDFREFVQDYDLVRASLGHIDVGSYVVPPRGLPITKFYAPLRSGSGKTIKMLSD